MVDYVDLLVGEVQLGDCNNTYLYVGEDQEAWQLTMGSFVRRITEEGYPITSINTPSGRVTVNGSQRFFFIHKSDTGCAIKGLSFDRAFVEVSDADALHRVKTSTCAHLVAHRGDFV